MSKLFSTESEWHEYQESYPAPRRLILRKMKRGREGGTRHQWEGIAAHVNAGKYDGADKSTIESLLTGLNGFAGFIFAEASARLTPKPVVKPKKAASKVNK